MLKGTGKSRHGVGAPPVEHRSHWFYDERHGDQLADYIPIDAGSTPDHWPSISARLTCDVAYARRIWAVFRRVPTNWVGPAGTYCQLIGRWSDGTVRLQVGLIDTQY